MEPVTTPRLIIRRFAPEDLADYRAYQTLPEVRQYLADAPMSEEQAAAYLARQAALPDGEKGHYHAYAVYHQCDARVMGDVGFFLDKGPVGKGDLGFQFHPDYHGQGYAREAAEAVLRHGFLGLNLNRITSGCDARNTASFRLMERLGMKREAHFRQNQITRGVLHDEYHYALLRDEWLALH